MATITDTHTDAKAKPLGPIAFLYLIFFVSGAAALIYEISWSRQIGLLFGHTIHAAGVVLASYFSGMAIGHLVGARWSTRISPLVGYGVAELVVAVWALLIPSLMQFSESPQMASWLSHPSFVWQTGTRVVFCMLLLLPATTALGATLPMMAQFLSSQRQRSLSDPTSAGRVSLAYAINTMGALTGVLLATFYLLVIVGVERSSFWAAGLSAGCGLIAIGLSRSKTFAVASFPTPYQGESKTLEERVVSQVGIKSEPDQTTTRARTWIAKYCLSLAALSGFGTLALEVLYVRMFSLVFHNSTYTFGAVLAVFLFSLSLGAAIVSRLQRRFKSDSLIAVCLVIGSVSVPMSVILFAWITKLDYFIYGSSFAAYLWGAFGLVAIVVVLPITCLGAILPLIWKSAADRSGTTGLIVGRMTAANTIAAAVGSLSASFFLMPVVDLWPSFALLAAPFCMIGLYLFFMQRRYFTIFVGFVAFSTLAVLALRCPTQSAWGKQKEEIVRRWQSPYGWIDVVRVRSSGALKISQNLHYRFGSTGQSAQREYRQAHIPLLLHKDPKNVLFLGLGTGMTAGGAVPHQQLDEIFIVELIPQVVEAARLLSEGNRNIVDHSNTTIHVDDARHFLLANERRFDVIVSDLFVPWESETGYLYTVEHYQIARRRLSENGLFCQWLPLYQMGPGEFELIADSFATVFPNTTLWWGHLDSRRPIIALIGSENELEIVSEQLQPRLDQLSQTLKPVDPNLRSAESIYELYICDWIPRHPERLNTDEHPRVEFETPVSHRDKDLLKGNTFVDYFDNVFSEMPDKGVRKEPESIGQSNERRRKQQFQLSR